MRFSFKWKKKFYIYTAVTIHLIQLLHSHKNCPWLSGLGAAAVVAVTVGVADAIVLVATTGVAAVNVFIWLVAGWRCGTVLMTFTWRHCGADGWPTVDITFDVIAGDFEALTMAVCWWICGICTVLVCAAWLHCVLTNVCVKLVVLIENTLVIWDSVLLMAGKVCDEAEATDWVGMNWVVEICVPWDCCAPMVAVDWSKFVCTVLMAFESDVETMTGDEVTVTTGGGVPGNFCMIIFCPWFAAWTVCWVSAWVFGPCSMMIVLAPVPCCWAVCVTSTVWGWPWKNIFNFPLLCDFSFFLPPIAKISFQLTWTNAVCGVTIYCWPPLPMMETALEVSAPDGEVATRICLELCPVVKYNCWCGSTTGALAATFGKLAAVLATTGGGGGGISSSSMPSISPNTSAAKAA